MYKIHIDGNLTNGPKFWYLNLIERRWEKNNSKQ